MRLSLPPGDRSTILRGTDPSHEPVPGMFPSREPGSALADPRVPPLDGALDALKCDLDSLTSTSGRQNGAQSAPLNR
jgi:hypothetical protein